MKWNARMSNFLTLNWYKTKNRKNTKLRVLVIDFIRLGGSEKNQEGSEKSCFKSHDSPYLFVAKSLIYWANQLKQCSLAFLDVKD